MSHGSAVSISPIERAIEAPSLLGESPFWHPQEQALYYCDIPARRVHRFDPRTAASRHWEFASEVASCAPMLDGDLLCAARDGLWRFSPTTGARALLAAPPYDTSTERFNDGKCDPQGRFWVGTVYEPRDRPSAALYRYDGRGLVQQGGGITVSNGLGWSPDGKSLYWSDTTAHEVRAFDFDASSGTISNRRVFAAFARKVPAAPLSSYGGRPDGAAVDLDGNYWVAMYEGRRVLCVGADGNVGASVDLPVQCPTMCCFGDADLKTLYITTARHGRSEAELAADPWAGCVLRMRVSVPGLPVNLFV
jgi:sugar lactone lactonase YvrE